jgi:ACS family D-galactonate transporter-like MFS transporter
MNFASNMMGTIVTGYIVGSTQSFTNAFLVAGVMLLIGMFAFIVLLGRIETIPDPQPTAGVGAGAP